MRRDGTYHDLYLSLFRFNADLPRKVALLTALMGAREQSWRVVGITPRALERLSKCAFKKSDDIKLARAHIVSRRDIAKAVFCRDQPLDEKTFLDTFEALDRTVLVLKKGEHHDNLDDTVVIPFPSDGAVHFRCKDIGFEHSADDEAFLQQLADTSAPTVAAATLLPKQVSAARATWKEEWPCKKPSLKKRNEACLKSREHCRFCP